LQVKSLGIDANKIENLLIIQQYLKYQQGSFHNQIHLHRVDVEAEIIKEK
jgi:hypothetical protein